MIELLVVIAIASIGVIYTSSTGEAESNVMADKSAKDALNEAEGQSGIGILGIDVVARKMRKVVGLREGAVSAHAIAEYKADQDEDDLDEDDAAMTRDDVAEAFDEEFDDWDEEAELAAAADEDWGDGVPAVRDAAPVADETYAEAEDYDDLDEADFLDDDLDTENWLRDAAEDRQEARPAVTASAEVDTENAPIVDEFDPSQDQILISYRPGEAGNGRIGILEDPLRPGSAAVTLGGRCVAVVLGGFGKVRAHHIDLVCEDCDDDMAA
jgi:hypothetical protein